MGAGKAINSEIIKIVNGQGTRQLDELNNPQIFRGRGPSNGADWAGAEEFNVRVEDLRNTQGNVYRILRLQTGTDAAGNAIYKYGYSLDHYKGTIHSFIEKIPPASGSTP